jgi:hypothetical protein
VSNDRKNEVGDLELATTKELVDELMNRFDTGFIFLRADTTDKFERRIAVAHGCLFSCIGMADVLRDKLKAGVSEQIDEDGTDGI